MHHVNSARIGPAPRRPALAALLLALMTLLFAAPSARAEWSLCNETSYVVEAAFAFDEGGKLLTEGWKRIRPGDCEVARRGDLAPGAYYFYARASAAHRGGLREWSGPTQLCVDISDFSIAGEANCEEVGFQSRSFVEIAVEPDEAVKRTALTELAGYTVEQARIAGVQRLLRDAGYDDRLSIDGESGARTSRLIAAARAEAGQSSAAGQNALIDTLERKARERAKESGLHVCNRTAQEMWVAMARRADDTWESRGWWLLAPEACATLIDSDLNQPAYYVYAALRQDGADTTLATANEIFCLAETRFAILGREKCDRRGYLSGRFSTVLADGVRTLTLDYGPADFRAPASEGLRR